MTADVWPTIALRRRSRWPLVVASGALALTVGVVLLERVIDRRMATKWPDVPPVSILNAFGDHTPVAVIITADWQEVSTTIPTYTLRSDVTLWRKMNFEDWDTVTERLREEGLTRMNAHDWDRIPQPIRAMAYIQMVKYWSGYYQIGTRFGLPRGTVNAIVMAESWFEHRASHTNPDGDRDIGLGGSSEYCRRTLQRVGNEGVVDFTLREEDYFDPWRATRVVAVWFELMLQEANGDLDLAIRRYHRVGRWHAVEKAKRTSQMSSGCDDGTSEMRTARQRGIFCSIEHVMKKWPVLPLSRASAPERAQARSRRSMTRVRSKTCVPNA